MKRKQFTFYGSFFEAMSEMNLSERGRAITILCRYALEGIEPEQQKGKLKIYWDLVQPNLAAGRNKALAGQIGGRAAKANKQVSKKEKEIEIENEIETETETDCGKGEDAQCRRSLRVGFERFWENYPVKIGKEETWEQWQRLCPDAKAVCESLEGWKRTGQWLKEKGRYIPRPARFLELEQYRQRPEVTAPCGALGQLGEAELRAIEKMMGG